MQPHEIEAWALRVLRQVSDKQKVEDALVELKREWPTDHPRAARQLAALANAALGAPVLWLIGVDEKEGVVGSGAKELSQWWPSVSKWFDPPAPRLQNLVTYWEETPVTALVFDTSARPFVTKSEGGGIPSFIVPWRDGNRTRTAKRTELIEMLAPVVAAPELEVLSLDARAAYGSAEMGQLWWINLKAYVHQEIDAVLVLPVHRGTGVLDVPEYRMTVDFDDISFFDPMQHSGMPTGDAMVSGPGRFTLRLDAKVPPNPGIAFPSRPPTKPVEVWIEVTPANSRTPLVVQATLWPVADDKLLGHWVFERTDHS